jgi:hypothetical protein
MGHANYCHSLAASVADVTRSKTDLIAKNAMLRQQLIALNRQAKRPQLTNGDRLRLVLLARCTIWQQVLHNVQPDTLIRWHRELFQLYWRYKSRKKNRNPSQSGDHQSHQTNGARKPPVGRRTHSG